MSACTRVDFHGRTGGRSFAGHLTFEGEPPISLDLAAHQVTAIIDGRQIRMTMKIEMDYERGEEG